MPCMERSRQLALVAASGMSGLDLLQTCTQAPGETADIWFGDERRMSTRYPVDCDTIGKHAPPEIGKVGGEEPLAGGAENGHMARVTPGRILAHGQRMSAHDLAEARRKLGGSP